MREQKYFQKRRRRNTIKNIQFGRRIIFASRQNKKAPRLLARSFD
jgi:hypothetical protein